MPSSGQERPLDGTTLWIDLGLSAAIAITSQPAVTAVGMGVVVELLHLLQGVVQQHDVGWDLGLRR